jgi:hypothetical protein
MKKTEYSDVHIPDAEERQLELDAVKREEPGLPQFAKEVPVSSRKRESGDSVVLTHEWKSSNCDNIRAREMTFRKGEGLSGVYKVNARDGVDTVSVMHGKTVYIFRKTTREVAKAIYNACSRVQGELENIVGWLTTVLGSVYLISRVESSAWSFDRRVARHDNVNYVESDLLDEGEKRNLCELIVQNIARLHSKRLVLGGFTLNSMLFTKDGASFTDLRGLRATRKLSYCVEEFKSMMQYLFARGMMRNEDRYLAIATYHAMNEQACSEWYREKAGRKAKDSLEITDMMEEEIFS